MGRSFWLNPSYLQHGQAIMATATLLPATGTVLPVLPTHKESSVRIGPEVIRNALFGKWCNVLGHSLTREMKATSPDFLDEKREMPTPPQVTLCPSSLPGASVGVFSADWIKEGTEMGPFTGNVVRLQDIAKDMDNRFMWEVFDDHGRLSHFVDASDESQRTWMCYVNCARNDQEQNLEVFQMGSEIFYRALKTIPPDQELLVYYGSAYEMFLGIPVALATRDSSPIESKTKQSGNSSPERLNGHRHSPNTTCNTTTTSPNNSSPNRLSCTVCRRGFNSRSNLRSHMRIHTLEKPFVCKFCHRRFSQSSTLRNHVRLHTGEKPYRCNFCQSAYSQLAGLRAHQKSARHRPTVASVTTVSPPLPVPSHTSLQPISFQSHDRPLNGIAGISR